MSESKPVTNSSKIIKASTKPRQSNIELLRIFAACGVIILHYNNAGIGGGFAAVADGSLNQFFMMTLEIMAICAVNLYVLISGYFMRDSYKRDLLKPIKLLVQLGIIELAFCLIKELPKGQGISFDTIFNYMTPSYWFIFVYIALYMISPYINLSWNKLAMKEKKTLLIVLISLFAVYPILLDIIGLRRNKPMNGLSTIGLWGSEQGYTIVIFVLMYLLGCYIRDKEVEGIGVSTEKIFLFLLIDIIVLVMWAYFERLFVNVQLPGTVAINYENPLVISEAILYFLLFRRIKLKDSKIINKLAMASFPTYLIHINLLEYCKITEFVKRNPGILFIHIIACTVIIYIISFIITCIYDLITKPLFKIVSERWKKCRIYSVSNL